MGELEKGRERDGKESDTREKEWNAIKKGLWGSIRVNVCVFAIVLLSYITILL